jgi:hypothetical protein
MPSIGGDAREDQGLATVPRLLGRRAETERLEQLIAATRGGAQTSSAALPRQGVTALDVEKARLERAFSLRLGRLPNGQWPTGWK